MTRNTDDICAPGRQPRKSVLAVAFEAAEFACELDNESRRMAGEAECARDCDRDYDFPCCYGDFQCVGAAIMWERRSARS